MLCALTKQPAWIAGLLLGLAALARLPVGLALPVRARGPAGLPGASRRCAAVDRGALVRTIVVFGLGLAVPAIVYVAFNLVRWGTILDQSYVAIPGVLEDPIYAKHGILSPWYIPRNVFADPVPQLELRGRRTVAPAIVVGPRHLPHDTALPVVAQGTPADADGGLGAAARPPSCRSRSSRTATSGITQFGYRFSLDFQLLLFVILATVVARGWTRLMAAAAVASIIICAYAVWAISIDFVAF